MKLNQYYIILGTIWIAPVEPGLVNVITSVFFFGVGLYLLSKDY